MSERYPRIRQYSQDGRLTLRDGLIICFFMRRPHGKIGPAVTRALDLYLDAIGPEKLGWYIDHQGDYDPEVYKDVLPELRPLDSHWWARARADLSAPDCCVLQLEEHAGEVGGFHFEYYGRLPETLDISTHQDVVSAVSFWLPTEFLEKQGPSRVRALATAMARELPLDSGYVSLAFNYLARFKEVVQAVHSHCFRYPGLDLHDVSEAAMEIGTRVRGAYWLNFYGQPLLGQLGGAEGLRQQLDSREIAIETQGEDKVLVALGEWPESGDVESKSEMRPYRALARVLEPYLYKERHRWFGFSREQLRRWQRRFLD